jgi:hypothetical protein
MVVQHVISYFIKNVTIYGTLRISSSIHHITLEREIKHQQENIKLLMDILVTTQNRMKQQVDQHRNEREFEVGYWVFFRLQPYKQMSLKQQKRDNKLAPKYSSCYKVLQRNRST